MKKTNLIYKLLALVIALASVLTAFTACKEDKPADEKPKDYLDISEYLIIRRDTSAARVTDETINLKKTIESELGADLTVKTDWYAPTNAPDPNAKEILVDKTNRKESEDALAKLDGKPDDSYIIDITENKIVIAGKSTIGTIRALQYFVNNYVLSSEETGKIDISAGKTFTKEYDVVQNIFVKNQLDMDVEVVSTIASSTRPGVYAEIGGVSAPIDGVSYPSVLELKYQQNKENNGKLIAIFNVLNNPTTSASVWESSDGGANWTLIARPKETIDRSIGGISMAHIYELPAQVGDMPAGTLLYSGNSVNYSHKSHIGVWRSFDAGYTWEEYTIVATAGGLGEGIWEPLMWYEESDGYLYCFYSDDSDPLHDQKLVYKRSKDGVNWSDIVEICAFDNPADRPGMLVMTKMGNGEYFMVYEYCGSKSCSIYYKTTKDITSWNPKDPGTILQVGNYTVGSAPSCIWTPAGGECGTLIATGMLDRGGDGKHRMFVSFDYGKTWGTIENPLTYDHLNDCRNSQRAGYHPSFAVGSDPSIIYYINTTDDPDLSVPRMQFARLKICE